jgi:hypothetical protein
MWIEPDEGPLAVVGGSAWGNVQVMVLMQCSKTGSSNTSSVRPSMPTTMQGFGGPATVGIAKLK